MGSYHIEEMDINLMKALISEEFSTDMFYQVNPNYQLACGYFSNINNPHYNFYNIQNK